MNDTDTAAAIREMSTAIGDLGGQMKGINGHLSSVSASVKTIEASTNDIKAEVAGIKIKDAEQDGRLDKIEVRPNGRNGTSVIDIKVGKLNREMVILILGLVSLATGGGAWIWSFIK